MRGLRGESVTELRKEYGVARSYVYALMEEAKQDREYQMNEALNELYFQVEIDAILRGSSLPGRDEEAEDRFDVAEAERILADPTEERIPRPDG